jgi:hypothetical protein
MYDTTKHWFKLGARHPITGEVLYAESFLPAVKDGKRGFKVVVADLDKLPPHLIGRAA